MAYGKRGGSGKGSAKGVNSAKPTGRGGSYTKPIKSGSMMKKGKK